MAFLKGKELAKAFSAEQLKELGFGIDSDFEIIKIKPGVWVFSEKPESSAKPKEQKPDLEKLETESKIFNFLSEKKLSERVEGKFEKLLSQKELAVFKELLAEGRVFAFKLSDKYKKPVYKIAPSKQKESEKNTTANKPLEEYCLEEDGLLVCREKGKAERISFELRDAIKRGEISGIKSFDGNYYIIENALLQKYKAPIAEIVKANKSIALEEIAKKAGISRILAKISCEFLKEDGEIIEKKSDQYQYIS